MSLELFYAARNRPGLHSTHPRWSSSQEVVSPHGVSFLSFFGLNHQAHRSELNSLAHPFPSPLSWGWSGSLHWFERWKWRPPPFQVRLMELRLSATRGPNTSSCSLMFQTVAVRWNRRNPSSMYFFTFNSDDAPLPPVLLPLTEI